MRFAGALLLGFILFNFAAVASPVMLLVGLAVFLVLIGSSEEE
jgi:hypothetical protein